MKRILGSIFFFGGNSMIVYTIYNFYSTPLVNPWEAIYIFNIAVLVAMLCFWAGGELIRDPSTGLTLKRVYAWFTRV